VCPRLLHDELALVIVALRGELELENLTRPGEATAMVLDSGKWAPARRSRLRPSVIPWY